jgi:hypothetical protein
MEFLCFLFSSAGLSLRILCFVNYLTWLWIGMDLEKSQDVSVTKPRVHFSLTGKFSHMAIVWRHWLLVVNVDEACWGKSIILTRSLLAALRRILRVDLESQGRTAVNVNKARKINAGGTESNLVGRRGCKD